MQAIGGECEIPDAPDGQSAMKNVRISNLHSGGFVENDRGFDASI
jgi:hypothetical protein